MTQLSLLPVIELNDIEAMEFIAYYRNNSALIEEEFTKNGLIKFSGVRIGSHDTFQLIVDSISDKFISYIDGNSPRTKLSGNVYTSTEYDNTQKITMHNELSYSAKWPNKLFFSCLQPAQTGGETLIADSREILGSMDRAIVEAVEKKGVMYIRNLHGGRGLGPSWQDTFETNDSQQVEKYCRSNKIEYEWTKGQHLKLIQRKKGILEHRKSKEKVWFNQIDQFHPSHLGEELLEAMNLMYDNTEDFPMYVRFGDGTDIDESMVREILATIDAVTIAPPWQENELLVIDNELVAHGRNPFTGNRKVLVAMSE